MTVNQDKSILNTLFRVCNASATIKERELYLKTTKL